MSPRASRQEAPPEWIDLTFVRLANSLVAKMGIQHPRGDDAFTHTNLLTGRLLDWLRFKFGDRSFEKAAARKLGDLEKARQEAGSRFSKALSFSGVQADDATFRAADASPELVLRTFCIVALRVHTALPDARMVDVVESVFRTVVLAELQSQLSRLEKRIPASQWPRLLDNDGNEPFPQHRRPSEIAMLIVDGRLERRHFDSASPKLRRPVAVSSAPVCELSGRPDREVARAASVFVWVLLRKAARTEETWGMARRMASEYIGLHEESQQQVVAGLGESRLAFGTMTLPELCDTAYQATVSSMGTRHANLMGKSFPQVRRRILNFARLTDNPTEADLRGDLSGSLDRLEARLRGAIRNFTPSECLAYAYHVSRRTTLRVDADGNVPTDPVRLRASELTCELLRSASLASEVEYRVVARRYLAGYLTNPRYLCARADFQDARQAIRDYESLEPGSLLARHFRARLQFATGDERQSAMNYRLLFLRAIPSGEPISDPVGQLGVIFRRTRSHVLSDMECISYLLPECYALSGLLMDGKSIASGPESSVQRAIRRISEAHFGVNCANWPDEEARVMAGFRMRSSMVR